MITVAEMVNGALKEPIKKSRTLGEIKGHLKNGKEVRCDKAQEGIIIKHLNALKENKDPVISKRADEALKKIVPEKPAAAEKPAAKPPKKDDRPAKADTPKGETKKVNVKKKPATGGSHA